MEMLMVIKTMVLVMVMEMPIKETVMEMVVEMPITTSQLVVSKQEEAVMVMLMVMIMVDQEMETVMVTVTPMYQLDMDHISQAYKNILAHDHRKQYFESIF